MSDLAQSEPVTGVGRLTVLTQDALDDNPSDINIGFKITAGSRRRGDVPVTFEHAQSESGTGIYQNLLLLVCGLVNMSCAMSSTAVSFIAPAAEDLNLSSTTKGLLNGAPFLGMMFGAYFWGICGDIKGRRFVILGSMGMDALFAILSCLTKNVTLFFIIRVGNGFAIIGAILMIYVYFGEFLTPDKRDSYLLFLEIFWAVGMFVSPGVAMMVIPSNIILVSNSYLIFNSWRLFLLLTSIPSLLSFILIFQYPETPRYLMLRGAMNKSRDILERIYFANHKNTSEPYSVGSFTQTTSAIGFNSGFTMGLPFMTNLRIRLTALKRSHKTLFSQYWRNITVTCIIEFCLMASYIAVLVWIPELFSRYHDYKENNVNDTNICLASEWYLKNKNEFKGQAVSSDAYLAALIAATSSIPLIILTAVSCGIPIIVSLVITITKSDIQAEIMGCIFEGFTTLTEPIVFCTMVELFPSNVRGVAYSMSVMIGRLGAVCGIMVFGIMIDKYCYMTFYLLAILLLFVFLAVMFLPKLRVGGGH